MIFTLGLVVKTQLFIEQFAASVHSKALYRSKMPLLDVNDVIFPQRLQVISKSLFVILAVTDLDLHWLQYKLFPSIIDFY